MCANLHGSAHQFCDPVDAILSPAVRKTARSTRINDMGATNQGLLPVTPLEARDICMQYTTQIIDLPILNESGCLDDFPRRDFVERSPLIIFTIAGWPPGFIMDMVHIFGCSRLVFSSDIA